MKVTMKEIAKIHHVSINTVSLALNNRPGVSEEMRINILKTAEELGYLQTKEKFVKAFARTNICIMMQKRYSQDMEFYGKVLLGAVEEAKQNGYDILMDFFDDDNLEVPKNVTQRRVSGVIIIGKISDQNIELIRSYRIPVVLVDHASLTQNIDSITTNNKLGGYVAMNYLIQKGFKKIGFFGDLKYSLSIKERYWGYREALKNQREDMSESELSQYIHMYSILDGIEEAVLSNDANAIMKLVQNHPVLPEVFVCSNDKAAISLMFVLQSLGYKIPDDISIIGFDNIELCERVTPQLTTIDVKKEIMGQKAVRRLLYKKSNKKNMSECVAIGVELVERDSVATPKR